MTHAAVVARGMGKPAVVGCEVISIDYNNEKFYIGRMNIPRVTLSL